MSLTDLQRAALQMLAKSPRGYALSTAVVRGFSFEMLQGLVRVGYATHTVMPSASKRRSFRTYGSLRLDGARSRALYVDAPHSLRDRADDARQHARARRAVARRVVLELPPPSGAQRRSLAG
jgi:hypothetical protein